MNEDEKHDFVRYKLSTATKTLEAAKILARNQLWNSTVNRLYYSAFYAVSALLILNDIKTKTHSSAKSQFSLHFIKSGKFDKKYGRLLTELYDWRQRGDYNDIIEYEEDSVLPLFEPVEELLELII